MCVCSRAFMAKCVQFWWKIVVAFCVWQNIATTSWHFIKSTAAAAIPVRAEELSSKAIKSMKIHHGNTALQSTSKRKHTHTHTQMRYVFVQLCGFVSSSWQPSIASLSLYLYHSRPNLKILMFICICVVLLLLFEFV